MRRPIGFLDVARSFLIVTVSLFLLVPAHSRAESNVQERVMNGETVQSERDEQQALFNYYFREHSWKYETQLDALSTEASVPKWRIPYSAAIHPETQGGLGDARGTRTVRVGIFRRRRPLAQTSGGSSVLNVYDRAFNGGQDRANSYEVRRIGGPGPQRGLFAAFRTRSSSSESWEGYCSGFTGSTIRHPEPVKPVDAGTVGGTRGVIFQPSDIKALLSCIYNRTVPDSYLYLASPSARTGGPNMGTFHLALANYIGQAGCPIGIDRTKGQVSWNNPIYAYKVNSIRDAGSSGDLHFKDVETTIVYTYYGSDNQRQTDAASGDRVGNRKQSMTLRYTLELDANGNIVGGRARTGAGHFLWIPLYAVQARPDGSAPGNPYVDVRTVLALARASAIPQVQEKFDNAIIGPMIDPSLESDGSATDETADDS